MRQQEIAMRKRREQKRGRDEAATRCRDAVIQNPRSASCYAAAVERYAAQDARLYIRR